MNWALHSNRNYLQHDSPFRLFSPRQEDDCSEMARENVPKMSQIPNLTKTISNSLNLERLRLHFLFSIRRSHFEYLNILNQEIALRLSAFKINVEVKHMW